MIVDILTGVFKESWDILNQSAPWVLIGFAVAALAKAYVPDELIARHLGRPGSSSVIKAALLGIPLPICSCGVVPAAIGLRKQGASRGATTAFLISTPETGVDSIALTWALMDPLMTLFRPIAAFFTSAVAGFLEDTLQLSSASPLPENGCSQGCCAQKADEIKPSGIERLKSSFIYTFQDILAEIGIWFVVGIAIAGLITYFVPDGFLEGGWGRGFPAKLAMLVVGIPLYVCATCTTPVAAAMVLKGLSPGAALVLLLAGPATNAATMSMVGKFFGGRSLAIYLVSIAVSALFMGWLLDIVYSALRIKLVPAIGCCETGEQASLVNVLASLFLLALIAWGTWVRKNDKNQCAI